MLCECSVTQHCDYPELSQTLSSDVIRPCMAEIAGGGRAANGKNKACWGVILSSVGLLVITNN